MTPSHLFLFLQGSYFAMFSFTAYLAILDRVSYFRLDHLFTFHIADLTNQTIGQIWGNFFDTLDRRILIDPNFNQFGSVFAPAVGRLFPLDSPLGCLSCQRMISAVCTHRTCTGEKMQTSFYSTSNVVACPVFQIMVRWILLSCSTNVNCEST